MSSTNNDENVVAYILIRMNEDSSLNMKMGHSEEFFSKLKQNSDERINFIETLIRVIDYRIDSAE